MQELFLMGSFKTFIVAIWLLSVRVSALSDAQKALCKLETFCIHEEGKCVRC